MKKYCVIDELNEYEILNDFDTIEKCKEFIKGIKEFDRRHNNPFKKKLRIYEIKRKEKVI